MKELDQYLQGMGKHLMILQTAGGTKRNMAVLDACFADKGYTIDYQEFAGSVPALRLRIGRSIAGILASLL